MVRGGRYGTRAVTTPRGHVRSYVSLSGWKISRSTGSLCVEEVLNIKLSRLHKNKLSRLQKGLRFGLTSQRRKIIQVAAGYS